MTVQECYQQIQGNYENVLKRLKTDERIVKFLELFLSDTTYQKLSESVNAKNNQEIFKCVHDLKGMALNLGLTALQKAAQNLCEAVRYGEPSGSYQRISESCRYNTRNHAGTEQERLNLQHGG